MSTFVVHNVGPMTVVELAKLHCGHCRHRLTMHVTAENGTTQCGICRCFRRAGEDILKPHGGGVA